MKKHNNLLSSVIFYVVLLLVIMGACYFFLSPTPQHKVNQSIQYSTFVNKVKTKKVNHITITPKGGVYKVTGTYRHPIRVHHSKINAQSPQNKSTKITGFHTNILGNNNSLDSITRNMRKHHTSVTIKPQKSNLFWSNFFFSIAPMLILVVAFYWIVNKSGGGQLKRLGKHKVTSAKKSSVRFSDVAGEDAEKQELVEIVQFLKNPKKYSRLGAKIPHGVLLEGPPGTGKTLLAKAVAGEANVPFYAMSGSDFVEMFVGVGASRVRSLFKQAKKHSPSIIFIDEIDAIGRKRGASNMGGNDERENTLNQLLVEMDGFSSKDNVIVMAATNRADVLDPALTRPGRFDRKVLVGRPDVRGRYAILKVHAKNKPFAKNANLKEIARQTPGFVGADLADLLNEAALLAARRNKSQIDNDDLSEAEDRVIAGPAKKNAVISPKEEKIVSIHEAGHTIVGLVLNDARVVHKVTIIPRGRAGGYTIMLPKEGQRLLSKHNAMEQLAGLMGGRVAEELYTPKLVDKNAGITSGASSDFKQATRLARAMVTMYGMSKRIGDVQLESPVQSPYSRPKYSEHTAEIIDEEVHNFMVHAKHVAVKAITTHAKQHHIIAKALLKYETLDAAQIKSLYLTGHMPKADVNNNETIICYPNGNVKKF